MGLTLPGQVLHHPRFGPARTRYDPSELSVLPGGPPVQCDHALCRVSWCKGLYCRDPRVCPGDLVHDCIACPLGACVHKVHLSLGQRSKDVVSGASGRQDQARSWTICQAECATNLLVHGELPAWLVCLLASCEWRMGSASSARCSQKALMAAESRERGSSQLRCLKLSPGGGSARLPARVAGSRSQTFRRRWKSGKSSPPTLYR